MRLCDATFPSFPSHEDGPRPRQAGALMSDASKPSGNSLTLTTGGITLLGVLLSVGVTVAFGLKGEWRVRGLAGFGTTVALAILVKVATASGRGPLARLAHWMIGSPGDR